MGKINTVQISGTSYSIEDSEATKVVNVTQAQYHALVTGGTVDPTVLYNITDAQAGDLSQYWTSAQTNSAITQAVSGKADTSAVTESINAAVSGKQDTLVSGTNIKTINNESLLGSGNIDIQGGGGSTYTAGRGIDITNDTISFSLPISAGTGTNALVIASDTYKISDKAKGDYSVCINGGGYHPNYAYGDASLAQGQDTKAYGTSSHAEGHGTRAGVENNLGSGSCAHAEGDYTVALGVSSHAEGVYTHANGNYSHAEGRYTITSNRSEHANGEYNNSVSASTTFGDSGNTLFSVGNGTASNARHNAFEIRQNGDIYCSDGTNDVKLQDTITATAANTTALGGLSLVKLTQAEYDALATKDNSTLYVIVN